MKKHMTTWSFVGNWEEMSKPEVTLVQPRYAVGDRVWLQWGGDKKLAGRIKQLSSILKVSLAPGEYLSCGTQLIGTGEFLTLHTMVGSTLTSFDGFRNETSEDVQKTVSAVVDGPIIYGEKDIGREIAIKLRDTWYPGTMRAVKDSFMDEKLTKFVWRDVNGKVIAEPETVRVVIISVVEYYTVSAQWDNDESPTIEQIDAGHMGETYPNVKPEQITVRV